MRLAALLITCSMALPSSSTAAMPSDTTSSSRSPSRASHGMEREAQNAAGGVEDQSLGMQDDAMDPAPGQHCGPGQRGGRGRMLVLMRISEELDLTEQQSAALRSAFRDSDTERRTLLGKRTELGDQLEAELAKPKPDDAALTRLTDDIRAIDRQLSGLPEKVFQTFERDLTPVQRARLALLRGKLRHRVERERQRRGAAMAGGRPIQRPERAAGTASGSDSDRSAASTAEHAPSLPAASAAP